MSYDNTNTGILSKNDRRETDRHPEYTGKINIDGKEYWLSGWIRERKSDGQRFFSLSAKAKEDRPTAPMPNPKPQPLADESSDDIPF